MSTTAPLQNTATNFSPVSKFSRAGLILQRKCACGSPISTLTGVCEECRGNRRLQTKLSLGASNDPLEQEADRVADQVLAATPHSAVSAVLPRIQRYTGQAGDAGSAPASVDRVLAGSGKALDQALQQDMGQRFGCDFSQVRVHTGASAEQSAHEVNANAYTVGNNIVFGAGRFVPGSHAGRLLIAHELTHVLQQSGSDSHSADDSHITPGHSPILPLEISSPADARERKPNISSRAVSRHGENAIQTHQSSTHIARQPQPPTSTAPALPTVSVGNFRTSGSTADSGENNCANCPRELGIHTADFKNGMELRGDITGHITGAQYDFKRTREGGVWKKSSGVWSQTFHDGPDANDDRTDADEQLTPINNHIYAEDIPGLGSDPASGDTAATEAVLKGSFTEWVNVRVGTGFWTKKSNECNWHSVSWVEKVGSAWQRKSGKNEISQGSITVGTGAP